MVFFEQVAIIIQFDFEAIMGGCFLITKVIGYSIFVDLTLFIGEAD